jgi:hypothetical protein
MSRRQFANAKHQAIYDLFRSPDAPARFGGGNAAAYRFGLANPEKPAKHVRGSTAYAAWAAGVDTAREALA